MLLSLTSGVEAVAQFITVLVLFVIVLAITYFTTRYIANYQKIKQAGGNITVVETCKIAPGKYIQIVNVGEKYIAVALGKDTVTLLMELSAEELDLDAENVATLPSFTEILEKVKIREPKK